MADPAAAYRRNALLLILLAFGFRAVFPLLFPVHLVGDEAYYWDWGRRPALGYYSKPPFIAWVYGLVDWLGGGSLYAIRLASVVFGTLSLLVSFWLTRKLFDDRTAFLAVLLAVAVPGNCLLSFVLTIDAPLVLAWSLSLMFLWKYVRGEQPRLSLFLLFLSLGVGHMSKQVMPLFPVLALAFLAWGRDTRPLLSRPGPWLALAGSFVFHAPLLLWNSRNDWITFLHSKSHFGSTQESSLGATIVERLTGFLEFVGTQLMALSPVTGVLLFMVTVLPLFRRRQLSLESRFLITFCGVPLVAILFLALIQKVQPNWPAILYIAGIPLVAAWFSGAISWCPASEERRSRLLRGAVIPGLLLGAFFYFGPVAFRLAGHEGHRADPNRRFIGSDRFAAAVQEVRATIPGWQDHFVAVAYAHRHDVSLLAFELPDQPRVYHILRDSIESQYQIWPGPWDDGHRGGDGVIVVSGSIEEPPPAIEQAFARVEKAGEAVVRLPHNERTYTVFRGENLIEPFPHPRQAEAP